MKVTNTFVMLGVAAATLLLAFIVNLATDVSLDEGGEIRVEGKLFPKLDEDSSFNRIDVVTYDADAPVGEEVKTFQLQQAQIDDSGEPAWALYFPFFDNPESAEGRYYPADNIENIGKLTAGLVDLGRDKEVTATETGHERLGVIDPSRQDLGPDVARGTRITMYEAGTDETLVDAVLGGTDETNPNLRHIRLADDNFVYSVPFNLEIDTTLASWVDVDLFKAGTIGQVEGSALPQPVALDSSRVVSASVDPYTATIELVAPFPGIPPQVDTSVSRSTQPWAFRKAGTEWETATPTPAGKQLQGFRVNNMLQSLTEFKIQDVVAIPDGPAQIASGNDMAFINEHGQNFQRIFMQIQQNLAPLGFGFSAEGERILLRGERGEVSITTDLGITYSVIIGGQVLRSGNMPQPEGEESELFGDTSDQQRYVYIGVSYNPEADTTRSDPPADTEGGDTDAAQPQASEGEQAFERLSERYKQWIFVINTEDVETMTQELDEYLTDAA